MLKRRIARCYGIGVPTGMAANPNAAPILFDRALLRARQARAQRGDRRPSCSTASSRTWRSGLQAVMRDFSDVADVWTPGAALQESLRGRFTSIGHIGLDASETLPLQPESLDLVVSALAFQFVNDLPGVLAQIRRALRPDGLLLAAMIGGDTLTELRQSFAAAEAECEGGVSPRVAPFRRSARCRRAVAARGLCAAGHRCRSRRGALRQRVRADGRSAADGRDQCPDRAAADADPPRHHVADGADLRASALPIPTAASAPPST